VARWTRRADLATQGASLSASLAPAL